MIFVNDCLPAMKHPDEWSISKLRLKNSPLFENDKLR